MNRQAIGPIIVALCCLLVLGVASTAMDSAVDTDPGEVINSDRFSLPYDSGSSGEVASLREDLHEATEDDDGESADETDSGDGGEAPESDPDPGSGPEPESEEEPESDPDETGDGDRGSDSDPDADEGGDGASDQGGDSGEEDDDPSVLDNLLALLRSLLALILSLLPWVLVFIGAALAITQRDRIRGLGDRLVDRGADTGRADLWRAHPVMKPENPIEDVWAEMIRTLQLEDRRSMTPREWARDAIAAGADPDAVEKLTETFEEVRYTEAPVTDDRIHEANRWFERIRRSAQGRGKS